MKVIVAGAGKIGRYLARDLAARGHDVTVVERSEIALAKVAAGVESVLGDACSPAVLEQADARGADVVVAATGDDEDNLVVSLLAKQEFAVPRVLARVNYAENEWLFDDSWGVDLAVSPPHLLTALVEEDVVESGVVPLLKLGRGDVELVEVRLDQRAKAVGQRVADLDLPSGVTLVALLRAGGAVPCREHTPFSAGDQILALTPPGTADELHALLVG